MNSTVEALIEIPLHSKNKYEVDEKTDKIKLDRVLYASMIMGSLKTPWPRTEILWIFWLSVIRLFPAVMCRQGFLDIWK